MKFLKAGNLTVLHLMKKKRDKTIRKGIVTEIKDTYTPDYVLKHFL